MNLPLIYSRVTKERPELVVVNHTRGEPLTATKAPVSTWVWRGAVDLWVPDDQAEAMIESRWLRLLPVHHGLMRGANTHGPRFYVDGIAEVWPCAATPLEVLAEFFVPGSTKEEA